jgi:hypothetical protein
MKKGIDLFYCITFLYMTLKTMKGNKWGMINVLLEPDKVEILLTKSQKKILLISKGKKNNLLVNL